MTQVWPRIKARHTTRVSPWMAIIEREVEFAPERRDVNCTTRSASRITSPLSRRCRIVAFPSSGNTVRHWRALPGNFLPGSSTRMRMRPRAAAENSWRRLALPPVSVHALGSYAPCTARLSNQGAFILCRDRSAASRANQLRRESKSSW